MGEHSGRLVSIVMPLYNNARFVSEAIESVLKQSYADWELIVIDDCSNDGSYEIAESYSNDERITIRRNAVNVGAAMSRNNAFPLCKGRWIAFLDSDDAWAPEKLERQLRFMVDNDASMCFTAYETVEENGEHRNFVEVPVKIDYRGFLKNTITCSHTMILDVGKIDKSVLMIPQAAYDFDYPEDLALWLRVLKTGVDAYGFNEVLAKNRKRKGSRSADKFKAVRRTWNQYRRVEGLSLPYSLVCLPQQLFHAVLKRI